MGVSQREIAHQPGHGEELGSRARKSGKPAIIEVKLDPEAITPTKTLTDIREGR
jgi:hypothetical protein